MFCMAGAKSLAATVSGQGKNPTTRKGYFSRLTASHPVPARGATHLRLSTATDFGWRTLLCAFVLKRHDTRLTAPMHSLPLILRVRCE